jgi:hypothetical protein
MHVTANEVVGIGPSQALGGPFVLPMLVPANGLADGPAIRAFQHRYVQPVHQTANKPGHGDRIRSLDGRYVHPVHVRSTA